MSFPTASEKFLTLCFPKYFKNFCFPQNVLEENNGPVASLQKLTALRFVEFAIANPGKRQDMEKIVATNPPEEFTNLIFNDSRVLSEFFLQYFEFPRITSIIINPTEFLVFVKSTYFIKEHEKDQLPLHIVLNIIEAAFKHCPHIIEISVNDDTQNGKELIKKIVNLARSCDRVMQRGVNLKSNRGKVCLKFYICDTRILNGLHHLSV